MGSVCEVEGGYAEFEFGGEVEGANDPGGLTSGTPACADALKLDRGWGRRLVVKLEEGKGLDRAGW
jgi:hypothetical protein